MKSIAPGTLLQYLGIRDSFYIVISVYNRKGFVKLYDLQNHSVFSIRYGAIQDLADWQIV